MTEAGMDEAGVSFALAKDAMPAMLDAADKENKRLFYEASNNFKNHMDVVYQQIEQLGRNLHDKDRNWISETARDKAVASYGKINAAIMAIKGALDAPRAPSSEASNLKSEWGEFSSAFDKLWDDYMKRGKQLADAQKEVAERAKLFKQDCKKCID